MTSRFDVRNSSEVESLLGRLPEIRHRPLVGAADLREITKVFENLPKLEYPINSASELIEQLGGSGRMLRIDGMEVDPMRMLKYMPAYYFPIASVENFVEKMAELIRQNRKAVDVPVELDSLKKQLPKLSYPINNAKELLEMVGDKGYRFGQSVVNSRKMIMERMPSSIFPINSAEDFDQKVAALMMTRPLLTRDRE